MKPKSARKMQQIIRGFSHANRIQIIELIYIRPNLSVNDIADNLNMDFRNASQHLQKMASSGLVFKHNEGNEVLHSLTALGMKIRVFLRKLKDY